MKTAKVVRIEGGLRGLECPYCGHIFIPRVLTRPVKECPKCKRYFLLPVKKRKKKSSRRRK